MQKRQFKIDWLYRQGSGALNEDSCLLGNRMCGVFDGATALNGRIYDGGKTGGYLASHLARDTFRADDAPLMRLTDRANRRILKAMKKKGVDLRHKENLWCTSLAVVRVGEDAFEWVQSGDSLILTIYKDRTYRLLVPDRCHDAPTLCLWREQAACGARAIFENLKEQIIAVRREMNVTYGALNGEREALDFISRGRENLEGIQHILLFTDGLLIPQERPEKGHRFDILVNQFLEGGLQAIYRYVHRLQDADPLCHKYPRFKPHDDIAAVSLSMA